MSSLVSDISTFVNNTSLIQNSQAQLNRLATQLNTGKKSQDLLGYGQDASRIVNLQSQLASNQAYVSSTTQVSQYLNAYDLTLKQLSGGVTKLSDAIASFSADSASSTANLTNLIQGLQVDATATLNTRVGDRYLYSGTRYSTQPVTDLTTIAPPTTPTAFTAVTDAASPYIPGYDTASPAASATLPVTQAYASQQVQIADNQQISYGVTSNDPSIQQYVYALQQAQAGINAAEPDRSQYFQNATSALTAAATGLQSLQVANGQNLVTVQDEQTVQKQTIDTLNNQLGNLQNVDTATVATQISTLQSQLQGTYKVTSSLLNLSLLNYLK